MLIQSNAASGSAYIYYTKNIRNLAKATLRLASGLQLAAPSDSAGRLGVAELMRLKIMGTSGAISSMENALGYSSSQDQVLGNVSEILGRMAELAASSVDGTKVTADRVALDAEFQSLASEVGTLATLKYNSISLFGTAPVIRVGVETTDTITFNSVALASLNFTGLSLLTAANASIAMSTLKTKATSLASLQVKARSNNLRVEHTLDIAQAYVANLSLAEEAVLNVNTALEMGNLMRQQMLVAAGQAVITQTHFLSQNNQRFFQFQA